MKYLRYLKQGDWWKWGYSKAVVTTECPKCGAPKEHYCSTPGGRKAWPPHKERMVMCFQPEMDIQEDVSRSGWTTRKERMVMCFQPEKENTWAGIKIKRSIFDR